MPRVNPDILKWARETAGLTLEEAAERVDINAAKGVPGNERLAQYEAGQKEPSRPLLRRMAKQYRRPLTAFYMSAAPRVGQRGQDFRTLPPDHSRADDAMVDALIRDVRARQEIVRALLAEEDETVPLPFVGSMKVRDGVAAVARSISTTLALDLREYRDRRSGGFPYLRAKAEKTGVFVLLIGNLGSYHTNLDVEIFRGFALADPIAPFVIINDNDAETAWSFSLLHELCHIWLGTTGVSASIAATPIEQFCNDVAGQILLPPNEREALLALRGYPLDELGNAINELAERWQISRSMIAYTLLREGVIQHDLWVRLSVLFRQQWFESRQVRRDRNRETEGGPNYYVVRRHRIGDALLSLAERTMAEGALSPSKAGKLLGVKPSNVYKLFDGDTPRSPTRAA
jgi:Zn-dependent peptidase ImmA (M78 family)